ncbi:MAG: Maf family protein [Patescibacteria group bacterium]
MQHIILASASPRRRALLRQFGIPFSVIKSAYRENLKRYKNPVALVKALSLGKARAVAAQHRDALVIAADTVVVAGRTILGKPRSREEARQQLQMLNGKAHTVLTGFTVIGKQARLIVTRAVRTKVYFRKLNRKDIERYLKSNKWRGFAGAYAIQNYGGLFIKGIEGDYYNVVGLPLCPLVQELKKFGVTLL